MPKEYTELPELLRAGEAARLLGMAVRRASETLEAGGITPVRTDGGHRRLPTVNVLDFVSGRISSPSGDVVRLALSILSGKDFWATPGWAVALLNLGQMDASLVKYIRGLTVLRLDREQRYLKSSIDRRLTEPFSWPERLTLHDISVLFGISFLHLVRGEPEAFSSVLAKKITYDGGRPEVPTSELLELFTSCLNEPLKPQSKSIAAALLKGDASLVAAGQLAEEQGVHRWTIHCRVNAGEISHFLTLPSGQKRYVTGWVV